MTENLRRIDFTESLDEDDSKDIKSKISDTITEEIIIGLCSPIGTNITLVTDQISKILKEKFDYEVVHIKLSSLIANQSDISDSILNTPSFLRYDTLIKSGNQLRNKYGPNVLAELAINEIAVKREEKSIKDNGNYKSNRICYIIDSIKNIEELNLFRLIYRDIFYFIGVFSSLELRVANLKDKNFKEHEIYKLIDVDSGEDINHGQMVTNTFVESDFFLRIENNNTKSINNKLSRFFNLLFNSEIVTPTSHEMAMYLASSAAGNSACLSRQVGACITDSEGSVLSVGWNDVPKVNGGVYQSSDSLDAKDMRCMNIENGICFNDREKKIINELLVSELISNNLIDPSKREFATSIIKKSRIKELIEFSRSVHAEMLAIITGSQKSGSKMIGGNLYCTTYPCHNCARHIISAGIRNVYYIEPYRKSLAIKLHKEDITEDESDNDKVRILMFDGISPRRYLELFKIHGLERKSEGLKNTTPSKFAKPKKTISLRAIPFLEKEVTTDLKNKKLINLE